MVVVESLKRLASGSALFALTACSAASLPPERHPCPPSTFDPGGRREAWLTDAPRGRGVEIPESDIGRVSLEAGNEPDLLLRDRSFVPLSDEDARRFAPEEWKCAAPRAPFLVRGVRFLEGEGHYTVSLLPDGTLHVSHGAFGGSYVPANREPLILCLPRTPMGVCVTAYVAE